MAWVRGCVLIMKEYVQGQNPEIHHNTISYEEITRRQSAQTVKRHTNQNYILILEKICAIE